MCLDLFTLIEDLEYRLMGYKYLGTWTPPGWRESAKFYLFTCRKHGSKITYAQGHREELRCIDCLREDLKENNPRVNDSKIPPQDPKTKNPLAKET
jgi:hypothetical protein